ncbi:hypothetical protein EYR38_002189 [Pleurotus pulmonarius]|nr:hypothetical protein EYR38_002189 [Pleurotus pulmonarius]
MITHACCTKLSRMDAQHDYNLSGFGNHTDPVDIVLQSLRAIQSCKVDYRILRSGDPRHNSCAALSRDQVLSSRHTDQHTIPEDLCLSADPWDNIPPIHCPVSLVKLRLRVLLMYIPSIPALVFDVPAFLLVLLRGVSHLRAQRNIGFRGAALIRLLVRDSIQYFLIIVVAYSGSIIAFIKLPVRLIYPAAVHSPAEILLAGYRNVRNVHIHCFYHLGFSVTDVDQPQEGLNWTL